jgi:hypothetical protein
MRIRYVPAGSGSIPPGAVPVTQYNRGLLVSGVVILGAMWIIPSAYAGLFCSVTYSGCNPALWWLLVPAAGPFIAAAMPNIGATGSALLIIDGVLQSTGLALTIAGILSRQNMWRITEPYGLRRGPRWSVAPMAANASIGLTLSVVDF